MAEKFIERGTHYLLNHGRLSLYETNCACKDVKFYFDRHVLTLMLSGHKTVVWDQQKLEFFPGTLFIPKRETMNKVSIPNASMYNPTKCLVLELAPTFIQKTYDELRLKDVDTQGWITDTSGADHHHFLSNDDLLIKAFEKLYTLQLKDHSPAKELVQELAIKEMLYRLFGTAAVRLLKLDFENCVHDVHIRKVLAYISDHMQQKISVPELARQAGMGQTSFYKAFKEATGSSPAEYILAERIKQAKVYIEKGRLTLQEVAYRCGFNSYEYFCTQFKKLENQRPSAYRRAVI